MVRSTRFPQTYTRTLTRSLTTISLSCRGDGFDDEAGDAEYSEENSENPLRNIVVYARMGDLVRCRDLSSHVKKHLDL